MSQQHEFKVDDRVSFTITTVTKQGMKISSREGRIEEISDDNAVVVYRKKRFNVPLVDLRLVGQRSALTEAFLNMGQARSNT
ncbi:MAG: hypothetical protein CMI09_11765 [Oceanospirillaceae bacterium]|nr:hypothetical protein [Oceanospirillaceae bacterium]|tara:strand:- start:278 stop:523 length:246 start_codon:yes stop_codon:yes gene_type:complete